MTEHLFEIGDRGGVAEKCRQEAFNARRAGNGDFGVAANDNRVAVVTGVAPAPDRALAHDHERGNLVKRIVQPIALERGAVARLVPARIRGGAVNNPIRNEGNQRPGTRPEEESRIAEKPEQAEPDDRVANGGTVFALEQLAHDITRHGGLIPLRFGEAFFDGQFGIHTDETVVTQLMGF